MATPQTLKLLLDDFNRANEGPPPSNSWTNGITTFVAGEGLVVSGNKVTRKATGGFEQGSYWSAADFGPNVELVAEMSDWTNTFNNGLHLFLALANIGSTSTDGYSLEVERAAATTPGAIQRSDNNSKTQLATVANQAVASGDMIAFQRIGNTLIGWLKPVA